MKFRFFMLGVLLCSFVSLGIAQSKAERKAILNALRTEVQKDLQQSVTFKVDHVKVARQWAFLTGKPLTHGGKEINYTRTKYADAVEAGAFDDGIVALLTLSKGIWKVKAFVIGATDVPWGCWWKEFRAPKEIFTYTEECSDQ